MTDHADTIRRAIMLSIHFTNDNTTSANVGEAWTHDDYDAAHAALDALLAERQQAIGERDAAHERHIAELNALDEDANQQIMALRARCEQAIDALERAADDLTHIANFAESLSGSDEARRASTRVNAAIVKLREQP